MLLTFQLFRDNVALDQSSHFFHLIFVGENIMCSILVIDDETNILNMLQEALTLFGHKVEVANDGRKGIQKFDNGSFDIVITDVLMPKLDGRDVVQHIRNCSKKSICIIGMSGTPRVLQDIDFDMILPKPFPLEELLGMVTKLNC